MCLEKKGQINQRSGVRRKEIPGGTKKNILKWKRRKTTKKIEWMNELMNCRRKWRIKENIEKGIQGERKERMDIKMIKRKKKKKE